MMKTSIKRLEKQNTTTKFMHDFKTSTHTPSRNELQGLEWSSSISSLFLFLLLLLLLLLFNHVIKKTKMFFDICCDRCNVWSHICI